MVLVCGGQTCLEDSCGLEDGCYSWRAGEEEWTLHSTLVEPTYQHLLAEIPIVVSVKAKEKHPRQQKLG